MVNIRIKEFKESCWALCSSTVIIAVDDETFPILLSSGGAVWFDEDWDEHVSCGPWGVNRIPPKFKHLKKDIEDVVNREIPWGCCGGCV